MVMKVSTGMFFDNASKWHMFVENKGEFSRVSKMGATARIITIASVLSQKKEKIGPKCKELAGLTALYMGFVLPSLKF